MNNGKPADRILRICTAGALLAMSCFVPPLGAATYTWTDVPRIVAISDPHGAYDAMVRTLENASVIGGDGNWSSGDTHLVITGDLLDRGGDSRKIMELIMQLETQAAEAGGVVHMLLGNHEVMNLVGDLRYVAPGEYAAFADEETAEEREDRFAQFLESRMEVGDIDEVALRAEFERDRPPGFFAHRRAFASDGKYGQWLLSKPLVIVINGNAFVHGGLPPLTAELGLQALNETLGADVSDYVTHFERLVDAGLFDPALNFYRHDDRAKRLSVVGAHPDDVTASLQSILDLSQSDVHSPAGPLWYRGGVGCSTLIEGDRLDAALAAVGAVRVVIGHTPTLTRGILERHDGRIIEIDTGMLNSAYRGSGHALIIERDELWVASERTADLQRVGRHPRRVGFRPGSMSDSNLEHLLANGQLVSSSEDELGRTIVKVTDGAVEVAAVFAEDLNRRGVNRELAAYRLDRLLDLDMVPVTVSREVDGDSGSLQFLPTNIRNEQERAASGQGGGAWCPLLDQWNAMYVYDALIYNEGRPPSGMLYNLENWQVILAGNTQTFGTRRGRPQYLQQAQLRVTSDWQKKLAELNAEILTAAMLGALDKRRIDALLKRRDGLLEGS